MKRVPTCRGDIPVAPRSRVRHGSMLMEAVLALPPLLWLVLACFQFIYIAYAKLMTEYAVTVALRVAEAQCEGLRPQEALRAARRVLCPVSYSASFSMDLEKIKGLAEKLPKEYDPTDGALTNLPDQVSADLADFPAAARQPLGWFPFLNAYWIEDQVEVKLTPVLSRDHTPGQVPLMACEVAFKCPLHVPFVAETLSAVGVGGTFKPKILYGKKDYGDVPYILLKARGVRVLASHQSDLMPQLQKGAYQLGE